MSEWVKPVVCKCVSVVMQSWMVYYVDSFLFPPPPLSPLLSPRVLPAWMPSLKFSLSLLLIELTRTLVSLQHSRSHIFTPSSHSVYINLCSLTVSVYILFSFWPLLILSLPPCISSSRCIVSPTPCKGSLALSVLVSMVVVN